MKTAESEGAITAAEVQLLGTVLSVEANYYKVQLDIPLPHTHHLLCTSRARLKKIGQQVMVGDRVLVEKPDWAGKRAAIAEILPRQTKLERPPIANVEQILLLFASAEPEPEPYQISRFLLKAESVGLTICLCFNKSDLVPESERLYWRARLNSWGYQPIFISLLTSMGLDELSAQLQGKITVVAGPSGVGKSSLINRIIPGVNQRVGPVSSKLNRGRHTTRHVELFSLPTGGLLADTPGFNQPDLDCAPEKLALLFPEVRQRLAKNSCQFSDCLHRNEPNCVVRGNWERYEHYLEFLAQALAHSQALHQQRAPESSLKVKTKRAGQPHYEPKLNTKKYRRSSRRLEHQNLQLQEFSQDLEEKETSSH
ncbi:MAG: small ribosomal subunit biogenesis GTPase RsgA [Oscillatoriaceae bacterium SKW80]|nr:small ribosomal subunit biogenesis GTPase RsgA [Oscillatoriaceae bacterium SKYG93]MCX8119685.1 small ribosomal subunit biogenesis GTPase RsgA [Oscillatoriaceae bacterium SKW80]MDW8452438.1 small ribosomal subunit biogenesis GTPase RsgA [Oscillatoriaceae cyanobacterium SKYGB_i_bin93]HIK27588.1 small ribosomal subunit biogenesis GTPase RsgA [Oscillatoriaceae cyanobacterium M7585_C2015_266]